LGALAFFAHYYQGELSAGAAEHSASNDDQVGLHRVCLLPRLTPGRQLLNAYGRDIDQAQNLRGGG
jgi:hypothetical protein